MKIKRYDLATRKEESFVWVEVWSKSSVCSLRAALDGEIDFQSQEQKRCGHSEIVLIPERFTYSLEAINNYVVERYCNYLESTLPRVKKFKVPTQEQQDRLNRYQLYGEEPLPLAVEQFVKEGN